LDKLKILEKMIKIILEKQFDLFLKTAGLNAETMPKIQLREREIAFYAGMSQMWKLFLEISELPEEDCTTIFDDMENQLSLFWLEKLKPKGTLKEY
jgi:uncharacterized protein YfbU (UPF0304 family)